MNTVTQETITGEVKEISTKGDYIVKFALKTMRESGEAWVNITSSDWQAWRLREGDEVTLTGELTSTVWENPFLNEKMETLEMETSRIMFA